MCIGSVTYIVIRRVRCCRPGLRAVACGLRFQKGIRNICCLSQSFPPGLLISFYCTYREESTQLPAGFTPSQHCGRPLHNSQALFRINFWQMYFYYYCLRKQFEILQLFILKHFSRSGCIAYEQRGQRWQQWQVL